ncbi:MAG: SHOCT domain-containing protein [Nitrososphaerota archaeon]
MEEKLRKLKRLYDEGAISFEAYERLRKEYEEAIGGDFREHIEKSRGETRRYKRNFALFIIIIILVLGLYVVFSSTFIRTVYETVTMTVTETVTMTVPCTITSQVKSVTVSDEIGDVLIEGEGPAPSYLDLLSASVTQINSTHIELIIRVNGEITRRQGEWADIFYFWSLDMDRDGGFETEVSLHLLLDDGVVTMTGASINRGQYTQPLYPDTSVFENTIIVIVSLADIGDTSSFNWLIRGLAKFAKAGDKVITGACEDILPNIGFAGFN